MANANAVKEAMNVWGRKFLSADGYDVLEDAEISFTDDMRWEGYCETCEYEEYFVVVSDGTDKAEYSGSMSSLLEEMTREIND